MEKTGINFIVKPTNIECGDSMQELECCCYHPKKCDKCEDHCSHTQCSTKS